MPLSTARRSGSNSATICQQVVALSVAPKPSAVDARYRPTHRQCFRRLLNLVNYEVTGVSSEQISDAIVVWSGRGKKGWPLQDDNLVVHEFGNDTAAVLLPIIHRLRETSTRPTPRIRWRIWGWRAELQRRNLEQGPRRLPVTLLGL
jgi:hypothetical protein